MEVPWVYRSLVIDARETIANTPVKFTTTRQCVIILLERHQSLVFSCGHFQLLKENRGQNHLKYSTKLQLSKLIHR